MQDAMPGLEELLEEAKVAHGHLCAGQVLGVRLAMFGCARLGIEEPRGRDRKRLVTFVEIDRCATDAIGVVTGCRLGKRALKFRDWGKMAATFIDLQTNRAIRIIARESSKDLASQLHPEIENKNLQQMAAYRELSDQDLFDEQWVRVTLDAREFPGYKGKRVACNQCGEGINYDRFLIRDGQTLCLSCAAPEERYYQPLPMAEQDAASTASLRLHCECP
jgi:formylmethanofuran dehydrogenase subunit E